MNTPKISVIIVYDKEAGLYDCISSALQQSFSNIEIICVNNGSKDNAEAIALELSQKADRIKLISIPEGISPDEAKKAGLSIAQGEFVIFIENNEIIEADFIKNLYVQLQKEKQLELKNKYLYRRSFIENDREISNLISDKILSEVSIFSDLFEEEKQKIKDEFDKLTRINAENIKNEVYEILSRFNSLEKLVYDKDKGVNERIKAIENKLEIDLEEKLKNINDNIQKAYSLIDSEIGRKSLEIDALKEETAKIKDSIEETAQNKALWALEEAKKLTAGIEDKISALDREIVLRYVNLKRIIDAQIDEIKS